MIGLYLNPPDRALVLCCDEKSQCQALEPTQPGLPLGMEHIRTQTHDYFRHGTVTLFAALNYLDGKIISRTEDKHTHVEWLRFLKQLDRDTPKDLDLHLMVDNYATKHAKVKQWLARHRRFHVHFTPTGSSWLNLVERFFADLTQEAIRNGSFGSVVLGYRQHLGSLRLAPATINVRLAAIRRLTYEASDRGLLSPELVAGIRRVKGVKQLGHRTGNWLTAQQARLLLDAPDRH